MFFSALKKIKIVRGVYHKSGFDIGQCQKRGGEDVLWRGVEFL